MIIVMPAGNDNPAGGVGSFWFNHAPPPMSDGKRWGDFIWKDLVNYIDSNYRTIPHRASHAIGGLSAGGQGALTSRSHIPKSSPSSAPTAHRSAALTALVASVR